MKTVHYFGEMYGWSKAEVLQLTSEEANYLIALKTDEDRRSRERRKWQK